MCTTRILFAVGCVGAMALGVLVVPAKAQYYPPPPGYGYPPPPGYGYPPPPGYGYPYGHRYHTGNGCPPGWTWQGGNCAPYQGPRGPYAPPGSRYPWQ